MKKFFKEFIWKWEVRRLKRKIEKLMNKLYKKISEDRGTGNHFDKYGM